MMTSQHSDHARQIAIEAHEGQLDKVGNPYFAHCERVASLVFGDEERTVAYLHDVVEKGRSWTLDRLKEEGFSTAVVDAVHTLTRQDGEDEDHFLQRCISNHLARPVKRADLEDNLVQAEQAGLDTSKFVCGLKFLDEAGDRPSSTTSHSTRSTFLRWRHPDRRGDFGMIFPSVSKIRCVPARNNDCRPRLCFRFPNGVFP